ncbi:hypothetical protein ES703_23672 [subsurface metagenome]
MSCSILTKVPGLESQLLMWSNQWELVKRVILLFAKDNNALI